MSIITLNNQNLTELTEENLIALCHLNNIKPNELVELNLYNNKLKNINFITENTPFINLEYLGIDNNEIKDINNIRYLSNLKYLNISHLELDNEKDNSEIFKYLTKLKELYCYNTFRKYTKEQLKQELTNVKIYK